MTIGIHFIRYRAYENSISFSSPPWLHIDNEPLVFIHLVNKSGCVFGGDNVISDLNSNLTNIISLDEYMDTLILDQSVQHAVTPIGSKKGLSKRDVILFTIENDNQST